MTQKAGSDNSQRWYAALIKKRSQKLEDLAFIVKCAKDGTTPTRESIIKILDG